MADATSTAARPPPLERLADWLLVEGNRLVVGVLLTAPVAAVVCGLVLTGVAPLTRRTPVLFLLFALVSANVTLVTVVVSINQFVLARHLESPGEVREGLSAVIDYREAVGETTDESVLPVRPGAFLDLLFRAVEADLSALAGREWGDADLAAAVERLTTGLGAHADRVRSLAAADPDDRDDGPPAATRSRPTRPTGSTTSNGRSNTPMSPDGNSRPS